MQSKRQVQQFLRALFEVISDSVMRDDELIYFCLAHLDGILEDQRSRVKFMVEIMNDFKNKMDLITILHKFIDRSQIQHHRDIASHVLSLLIE